MPSILGTLLSSADALKAFERELATIQNNVANASTPNYARQQMVLEALPFDLDRGMSGGVKADKLSSARDEFAERSVRRELQSWGYAQQRVSTMSQIEPLFDATGESGIPQALSRLFQAFSALSTEPNDAVTRRVVLDRAEELAARFRETATTLGNVRAQSEQELTDRVEAVNRISEQISQWNRLVRSSGSASDPNLDAELHRLLETLAEHVDFTALRRDDGTVSVMLGGGQSPLVIGDQAFRIGAVVTADGSSVVDANGTDITSQISSGSVAALVTLRNTTIVGYINDLNRLAAAFADRVNEVLASGIDANGDPGAALFSYDATAGAALTLRTEPLQVGQLAAAAPGDPGGNANALALVALSISPEINGESFTQFYGTLAARAGRDLSTAKDAATAGESRVIQARDLRDRGSAVSLDEEAVRVIQLQRSYQAVSRLITLLDELTETTINILR
ncbi:MAG: flagellar hook-associated protein FlgK [bacterium]|jgi:flagellar hook-associated protein 1 FlgK